MLFSQSRTLHSYLGESLYYMRILSYPYFSSHRTNIYFLKFVVDLVHQVNCIWLLQWYVIHGGRVRPLTNNRGDRGDCLSMSVRCGILMKFWGLYVYISLPENLWWQFVEVWSVVFNFVSISQNGEEQQCWFWQTYHYIFSWRQIVPSRWVLAVNILM
jgi:hypothetical protein